MFRYYINNIFTNMRYVSLGGKDYYRGTSGKGKVKKGKKELKKSEKVKKSDKKDPLDMNENTKKSVFGKIRDYFRRKS